MSAAAAARRRRGSRQRAPDVRRGDARLTVAVGPGTTSTSLPGLPDRRRPRVHECQVLDLHRGQGGLWKSVWPGRGVAVPRRGEVSGGWSRDHAGLHTGDLVATTSATRRHGPTHGQCGLVRKFRAPGVAAPRHQQDLTVLDVCESGHHPRCAS